MNYFIKRETGEYGPYTLAELQRYVASGNIVLADLCRSEGMADWIPVSQVIGTIPVPQQAVRAVAPAAVPASLYPPPPALHWGLALLLGVITCCLFGPVWAFVQAAWIKKVKPQSNAIVLLGVSIGLSLVAGVVSVWDSNSAKLLSGLLNVGGWVLWMVAAFDMKSSIEEHYTTAEPIGLRLNGALTAVLAIFYLQTYYFQYHFTAINEMKNRQAGSVGYPG